MIGSSVAHYSITSRIGAGGMGEVYQATDTRLGRKVALKILPEAFASDGQRMARFGREARLLASLNHPNIAAIYGLEEIDGQKALVMELAEGEDLSQRISRGPTPLAESLKIAVQVAQALEAAHDKGIIHRDLKPANIKVSRDGQVKVLDFGLAKALEEEVDSTDVSRSPTLSLASTQAGLVLGTASYMSPEQARGASVDRRTDIWAFGAVLFEMITGRQAFGGDTLTDILGGIVHKDPDWEKLPSDTPRRIRVLLNRCLRKDISRRLQAVGDARIIIQDYLEDPEAAEAIMEAPAPPLWRRSLPWAPAALLGLALLGAWLLWPTGKSGDFPVMQLSVDVSSGPIYTGTGSSIEVSRDGRRLAIIGAEGRQLLVRSLDRLTGMRLVAGQPYNPFFSPDGEWVGYVTTSELMKIPFQGGTPLTLCPVSRSRGASWGEDDTIVFAPTPTSPLFTVSAAGGESRQLTTLDESRHEVTHRWPQWLPGGKAILFTSHTESGDFNSASIEVFQVDSRERKVLQRGGSYARYVPSGHLVWQNGGTLFAAPFDLQQLEVTGSPAPVVQEVSSNSTEGGAQFSFSNTGLLVYRTGTADVPVFPAVWVDSQAKTATLWEEPRTFAEPRFSPDGRRVAFMIYDDNNWDVWVYDLEREVATRLTFEDGLDGPGVWSPDGEYIAFSSSREGAVNIFLKRSDGSGETERLTESNVDQFVSDWSDDGKYLIFAQNVSGSDLWSLALEGNRESKPYLQSQFEEAEASFSPDGRWVAYASNESGAREIYVRPFPAGGGKWQVSNGGGNYARWSRDGRQLFFRNDEGLMSVSIETDASSIRVGKPRAAVLGAFRGGAEGMSIAGLTLADYDVAPGQSRFVMFPAAEQTGNSETELVTVITNWFERLRSTVATTP